MTEGPAPNALCQRLGLGAVRVEQARDWKDLKLIQLMILTLLERGEPMTLEEIAARILEAGFCRDYPAFETALLKSWHGVPPLARARDGRFRLIEDSGELEFFILLRFRWKASRAEPQPEPPPPPDSEPLSPVELEALLRHENVWRFAIARVVAAVIDAVGGPLAPADIEARLPEVHGRTKVDAGFLRNRPCPYLAWTGDGRLAFDPAARYGMEARRAMRTAAREVLKDDAQRTRIRQATDANRQQDAVHALREARRASEDRAALVHAVPSPDDPRALAIVDLAARTIETATGPAEIARATAGLGRFSSLIGLHIDDALHALRFDPAGKRLVDLRPPQKTRRVSRGRILQLTPERLMRDTLGAGQGPSPQAAWRADLRSGREVALRRRLEDDARRLCQFYDYGVLHHAVVLSSFSSYEFLPVPWALPGQPWLYDILEQSIRTGRAIDVVLSRPAWDNPWEFACRMVALEQTLWEFSADMGDRVEIFSRASVFAARVSEGAPGEDLSKRGR